jgi:hypothetical protein
MCIRSIAAMRFYFIIFICNTPPLFASSGNPAAGNKLVELYNTILYLCFNLFETNYYIIHKKLYPSEGCFLVKMNEIFAALRDTQPFDANLRTFLLRR